MTANTTEKPVAIVTGASSGIGLGITQALLERGYCVVGNSRSISKSKELKASGNLVLVDGDISKKETAMQVADAAIKHSDASISSSTTRASTFRSPSPNIRPRILQ